MNRGGGWNGENSRIMKESPMDLPVEVDSRGRGTERDPTYYVLTDRFGRVIVDTLNCDSRFEPKEQKEALEEMARALNQLVG
jgi:hypothetical protein